jgi:putative MATE family efflux protein
VAWAEPKGIDFSKPRLLWRSILVLAVPIALQMLLQSFIGMSDVIMVGNLGPAAIAAVGLAAKIHFLLIVLMSGLGTGCSVLIAQYLGARDMTRSQAVLSATLLVGTVVVLPLVLIFGFTSHALIGLINPDPEVVLLTAQYMTITAPILLIMQWIVIYESALRAQGLTGVPLLGGVVAALINVLLNYALINGNWGFPALGVAGAAWATVFARSIQLGVVLAWVYFKRHPFAPTKSRLALGCEKQLITRFIWFSLPLIANYAIWAIGNTTYHFVTGFAGTEALAVMGVIVPVESAFFALFVGLANACAVLIGRELGAGNNDNAMRLHKFFDRLTIFLLLFFCTLLWFSRPWLVGVFDQLDEKSAQLMMDTLGVFCVLVALKMFNMMRIIGVIRAGGDNRFTLVVDTLVMWGFGLPLYIAAVIFTDLSFIYLYALMFVEDALKFIPVIRRIKSRKWMNNLTH